MSRDPVFHMSGWSAVRGDFGISPSGQDGMDDAY